MCTHYCSQTDRKNYAEQWKRRFANVSQFVSPIVRVTANLCLVLNRVFCSMRHWVVNGDYGFMIFLQYKEIGRVNHAFEDGKGCI